MSHWKIIFKLKYAVFLFLITLTGCSVFAPVNNPQNTIYVLNKINVTSVHATPSKYALLITPPQTTRAYDTNQIIYITKPYELAYFSHSYWADTPAQMLLPLMVQSLQNSGRFHAVIAAPSSGNYNYILNTQLLQLQQEFLQHPSQVRLVLRAQLINNSTQRIIATREFVEVVTAPQDNPYGGVVAANHATAKLLQQLTAFCIQATQN